jgi:predicted HTH transcriptional regulator
MNEKQVKILRIINKENRTTPRYIKNKVDIEDRELVHYHLTQLCEKEEVRQVTRGLYEIVPQDGSGDG